MKDIEFFVPGKPVPKGRPRFAVIRGRAVAYTPKSTADYESKIRRCFLQTDGACAFPDDVPLMVSVEVRMPIPTSASKTKKAQMMDGTVPAFTGGDTDNFLKVAMDACQGLAFKNDKTVVACTARKVYAAPGTEGMRIKISDISA